MHMTLSRTLSIAALMAACASGAATAQQSTEFTYQGALQFQGEPYEGGADFVFRIWDSESAGAQVASSVLKTGVSVDEGLFQTPVDFGSSALTGDRWLEVLVRTPAWDGQGPPPAFTSLPGRQRISASPYALQTRGIFVNEDGDRVGIGTNSPASTLHVDGDARIDGDGIFEGEVEAGGGIRMNGGLISNVISRQYSPDFGFMQPGVLYGFSVTVTGVRVGDLVLTSVGAIPPGVEFVEFRILEDDLVQFRFRNTLNFPLNPPPIDVKLLVFKQ